MPVIYGNLEVLGDFTLVNALERGFDRDFILRPNHNVVDLELGGFRLQFVSISRILVRASLESKEANVHLLSDTDLQSAVANFTFNVVNNRLIFKDLFGHCIVQLEPRNR